jgi:hypothetical protein
MGCGADVPRTIGACHGAQSVPPAPLAGCAVPRCAIDRASVSVDAACSLARRNVEGDRVRTHRRVLGGQRSGRARTQAAGDSQSDGDGRRGSGGTTAARGNLFCHPARSKVLYVGVGVSRDGAGTHSKRSCVGREDVIAGICAARDASTRTYAGVDGTEQCACVGAVLRSCVGWRRTDLTRCQTAQTNKRTCARSCRMFVEMTCSLRLSLRLGRSPRFRGLRLCSM